MSIEWQGYELYGPGVVGPPRLLPRAEARELFKRCMETKTSRIEMLRTLLRANGVALGTTDPAIQDLNDWFTANVEGDLIRPDRLSDRWVSVVHDIGLFLGEVVIERHPNLHWEFFTWGKTNVAFQRHVIMGFSTENPKFHTNLDVERSVSTYGHRILATRGSVPAYGTVRVRGTEIDVDAAVAAHHGREIETDGFWRWLQTAAQRA